MGASEAAEIIAEQEVTPENIRTLFRRAFYSASVDEDGDVCIDTDGPRVFITVKENIKMLRYMTVYGVKESAPLELKNALPIE